jgi:hypothetical protein
MAPYAESVQSKRDRVVRQNLARCKSSCVLAASGNEKSACAIGTLYTGIFHDFERVLVA